MCYEWRKKEIRITAAADESVAVCDYMEPSGVAQGAGVEE